MRCSICGGPSCVIEHGIPFCAECYLKIGRGSPPSVDHGSRSKNRCPSCGSTSFGSLRGDRESVRIECGECGQIWEKPLET